MKWRSVFAKRIERDRRRVRYRSADGKWEITGGHVYGEVPKSTNYFYFLYFDGIYMVLSPLLRIVKAWPDHNARPVVADDGSPT